MRPIYVCGFLFSRDHEAVLLVQKKHPAWQRGLLNGVGGKHEGREMLVDAMRREFLEETGLRVTEWQRFAFEEQLGEYVVHFYRATLTEDKFPPELTHVNDVGENVLWVHLDALPSLPVVGNLRWLIPLALDWRRISAHVSAGPDSIKERPSW